MSLHTEQLGMVGMSRRGVFSSNFASLQLQITTLLEECGGERALKLLDALCRLNASEQRIVLQIFSSVVDRILSGELRLETASDLERREFENRLFGEIIDSLQAEIRHPARSKFEVVDGGKQPCPSLGTRILEFEKWRKWRRPNSIRSQN